jgi:abequosyltransferase
MREIQEALDSIRSQMKDNQDLCNSVEIVIVDNHSTDDTEKVVNSFRRENEFIAIKFVCNKENIGADRNFLKAVSEASGKYCWLMGSDDKLASGSIVKILNKLKENHTIYLLNRYNCTKSDMRILNEEHFLKEEIKEDKVFTFQDEYHIYEYLNSCNTIAGLFSYLTGLVFLKESWDKIKINDNYLGLNFAHVVKLLGIMSSENTATLKYIYEPLVLNRCGNDSFKENEFQRALIDLDAFYRFSEIFTNVFLQNGVKSLIKRTYATIPIRILLCTKRKDLENGFKSLYRVGFTDSEIELYSILARHKLFLLVIWLEKKIRSRQKRKFD